jgi:hypothetical protein
MSLDVSMEQIFDVVDRMLGDPRHVVTASRELAAGKQDRRIEWPRTDGEGKVSEESARSVLDYPGSGRREDVVIFRLKERR